jgi:hypothetical protein
MPKVRRDCITERELHIESTKIYTYLATKWNATHDEMPNREQ